MLGVANKSIMLGVVMLNVVMISVIGRDQNSSLLQQETHYKTYPLEAMLGAYL
jgi:hypothetical protein